MASTMGISSSKKLPNSVHHNFVICKKVSKVFTIRIAAPPKMKLVIIYIVFLNPMVIRKD